MFFFSLVHAFVKSDQEGATACRDLRRFNEIGVLIGIARHAVGCEERRGTQVMAWSSTAQTDRRDVRLARASRKKIEGCTRMNEVFLAP